jgi:hypothetical protein
VIGERRRHHVRRRRLRVVGHEAGIGLALGRGESFLLRHLRVLRRLPLLKLRERGVERGETLGELRELVVGRRRYEGVERLRDNLRADTRRLGDRRFGADDGGASGAGHGFGVRVEISQGQRE